VRGWPRGQPRRQPESERLGICRCSSASIQAQHYFAGGEEDDYQD
jgi:hypothetical protein